MENTRLFQERESALGQAQTPIVYYVDSADIPLYAGYDLGNIVEVVEDDEPGSATIQVLPRAPKLTITIPDTSPHSAILQLTCERNDSVEGEIVWTCNLPSPIYTIEGSVLTFKEHFQGNAIITATADNAKAYKVVAIDCGDKILKTYYKLGTIAPMPTVNAATTSTTIHYTVIPTYIYASGKKEVGDPVDASRIVYFPTNPENYDVIYENTFVDAYNVSVTWEVKQESNKIISTAYTFNNSAVTPSYVDAAATSATVNYSVTPVYTHVLGNKESGTPIYLSHVITFPQNPTSQDKSPSGSFTDDEHNVTINWQVNQHKDDTIAKTEYVLTTSPTTPTVEASATTANITYTVTPIYTYSLGRVESGTPFNQTQTVNFTANSLKENVTKSGTFTDEYGIIINWQVNQNSNKIINTTYALGTIGAAPTVEAAATSATINYTVIPTYIYEVGEPEIGDAINKTKDVTFAQNPTSEDVTRNGSFTDATYSVLVNWSVNQAADTVKSCDYVLSIAYNSEVEASSTSSSINCSGITNNHYSLGWSASALTTAYTETVTYEANTSSFQKEQSGTLTWNNVEAEWKITQLRAIVPTCVDYALVIKYDSPVEATQTSSTIDCSGITINKLEDDTTESALTTAYTETITYGENTSTTKKTITGTCTWNEAVVEYSIEQKREKTGLLFTANAQSTLSLSNYQNNTPTLYKSSDGLNWVDWDYSVINLAIGEKVYIKGNNPNGFNSQSKYSYFVMTGQITCSGSIMELLGEDVTDIPCECCFRQLFYECRSLYTAPELPATTLAESCYSGMFMYCSYLTIAPELPATTLAQGCYENMFYRCTYLTTAPELPATTLAERCYSYMFWDCLRLTTAPELPATTLANDCYDSMFYCCSSLATAPKLPATTLTDNCYRKMFGSCSSLTTAPELPATTLANYCYSFMFSACRSLTTAPELPATTLAQSCYSYMFDSCSRLTTAPELPATTLAQRCYSSMFYECKSLTTAPSILPATTLTNECYYNMFDNCKSLTRAPELPATTLAESCYSSMFWGCTSLNYIKAMFTTEPSTAYTDDWVSRVAEYGTFIKNPDATWDVRGNYAVPTKWNIYTDFEKVDLGLPSGLKWAKCNVGAETEEGYGKYFQWGDTVGYEGASHSTWATAPFNNDSSNYDETYFASVSGTACPNGILALEYDAARANMGGNWRMPTPSEFQELYDNTNRTWTTINGVNGYKFAKKDDASKYIFIPASGIASNGSVHYRGSYGYVWSSSLISSDPSRAYYMSFDSSRINPQDGSYRFNGFSVRGVSE